MGPLIQLALTLLQQVVPQLGGANAQLITKIINGLVVLVPILIQEYKELVPVVKNIISVLKNSGNLNEDQWNQLIEMEVKIDAAFDEAANKALVEDEAAAGQQQ